MPEKQVDEQQVQEQEAQKKGMRPLDEKSTMALFTDAENTGTGDGIPDNLSGSPEEEQPAQQPSPDDDDQDVEDYEDIQRQQSSEESVDDSEGSPSQESESEEEEQTEDEQPESEDETDFGDFMMSLGDDGINITKAEKPKSESNEQSQDTSNLSDEERARLWQSNYDKERAKRIELENRIAALEDGKAPDKPQQQSAPKQQQPERFNKRPANFMPQGSEFDETEALDSSTLSGQAYNKWLDARDQHNQQQFRQQLFSELDQRENQRQQKETYQKQIDYLKDKAKVSDDEVKDLLQFAAAPRQDGLYLIHLARKLANGQLPLSGKALAQLRKLYEPEKKASSTVAQKSSTPKQKKSSETDIFADGWNTTI